MKLRLATLLFPPLGMLLLWRRSQKVWRKVLGTIGILLYSLLYVAGVAFLLVRYTGLEVEWRGGYVPRLTYHKTRPDFEALEKNRAARSAKPNLSSTRRRETTAPQEGGGEAHSWPGFRGPRGDGISDEPILTNWPTTGLRCLWRQPIGGGYSSFAVAEGLAFTIEQRREQEVATAYDVETGQEVWAHGWPATFSESMGGDGPRATPAYADGKVYFLGAEGALFCLESRTGKEVWSKNILAENHASTPSYGMAVSPLVVGQKLFVLSGGQGNNCVVCYNRENGQRLWSALNDGRGYSSPMFVTVADQPQVLFSAETRTVGVSAEDGKLLWEYPWQVLHNQSPIAQPVLVGSNRFMLSAGYFTGCAGAEVTRTSSGFSARKLWQNKNLKNKFSSSVFWQGYIYGLDEDILTCLDAETGERKWKDGRYGYGQLLLASGHLVIVSGEGELALVKASPARHEELARFQAIQGKTWNYPALANGKLFVRNSAEMACFGLGVKR